MRNSKISIYLAGAAAGIAAGLFGSGGGMILVPALDSLTDLSDEEIFPASVSIILPICVVVLFSLWRNNTSNVVTAIQYLPGSVIGGLIAGVFGKKLPTKYLHKILGALIIWGGIKYLC